VSPKNAMAGGSKPDINGVFHKICTTVYLPKMKKPETTKELFTKTRPNITINGITYSCSQPKVSKFKGKETYQKTYKCTMVKKTDSDQPWKSMPSFGKTNIALAGLTGCPGYILGYFTRDSYWFTPHTI
jgi:hypothetical protein